MRLLFLLLAMILGHVGCVVSEEEEVFEDEFAPGLAGVAPNVTTKVNRDPAFVVVWTQNLAKAQLASGKLARCAADRDCAGTYLPDVVLLNEANTAVATDFATRLSKKLGVNYLVFADASRAGTAILWRRGRFGQAQKTRRLAPRYKDRSGSCTALDPTVHGATVPSADGRINTGRNVAVVLDDRLSGHTLAAISVHFPHPYEGGIPNCNYPASDFDSVCARRNVLEADELGAGGDLVVLGGDFNYRSKCDTSVAGAFKFATGEASGRFQTPLPYASAFSAGAGIDYMFARSGTAPAEFEDVERISKEFYCEADEQIDSCRWSDHDLRRAIVHY